MATVVCPRCEFHTTEDSKRPGEPGAHFCAPDEGPDLDALYAEQNRRTGHSMRGLRYATNDSGVGLSDSKGGAVVFDWPTAISAAYMILTDARDRGLSVPNVWQDQ